MEMPISVIPLVGNTSLLNFPRSSRVIKHQPFLKKLYKTAKQAKSSRQLDSLLKQAKPSEIQAISETSQNLLKKTYPKTDKRFLKLLLPFKSIIRKIASPKTTARQTKNILRKQNTQTGGLPFLVPLLAPIIGSLISAGIESAF